MTEGMSPADVAAVVDGNGRNGLGWGGDATWLIILFLFAAMGGWGNGFGGNANGGVLPYALASNTDNLVTSGFNQAATAGTLAGIQNSINNGFATMEVANCGRAMDAMQTAYNNEISALNRSFAAQTAVDNRLDTLANNQQSCCCENRLGLANLTSTILSENCADRAAISDGIRDIIANQTAGVQRILDVMCQDKIDAKNERITALENQVNMQNLAASQAAQTAALIADNTSQTATLINRIAPYPIPAYPVYGYGNGYGYGFNNGYGFNPFGSVGFGNGSF